MSEVTWTGSYGAIRGARIASRTMTPRKQSAAMPKRSPWKSAWNTRPAERLNRALRASVGNVGAALLTLSLDPPIRGERIGVQVR